MATGFQCTIKAVVSLNNVNFAANPVGQVLTINVPAVPCIGAATTEAAAITASLAALSTAITAAVATPFLNELLAQETGGG